MRNKVKVLGAAVALAVAGASQASTSPIIFDTNGAAPGGTIEVASFDWTQDNGLAVGSVPIPTSPTTTTFDFYYQASLGNFVDSSNTAILGTGLGSLYEITIQMGFTEIGTSTTSAAVPGLIDGSTTAVFALAPTQTVNFIKIYYDTTIDADQVAGTGYGDGTLIIDGVVTKNTTSFTIPFDFDADGDGVNDSPTIDLLDNKGSDDQDGTLTLYGGGGGTVQADVTSIDGNYILSDIVTFLLNLEFNTSQITPFSQADPSDLVVGNAPVYGVLQTGVDANGDPIFATVNGAPCAAGVAECDFHFQSDANTAFYVTSVPEPGSLLLLGAGLMGMGWAARRRKA